MTCKQLNIEPAIQNCGVCNSEAAVDFEEHEIYCTGCNISVQNSNNTLVELTVEWNNIVKTVLTRLVKQKNMPKEFVKLVDEQFCDLT